MALPLTLKRTVNNVQLWIINRRLVISCVFTMTRPYDFIVYFEEVLLLIFACIQ